MSRPDWDYGEVEVAPWLVGLIGFVMPLAIALLVSEVLR